MSDKLVIFGASLRRQAWGCLLAENSPRKYILQFHEQLHERIEPLDSVVASLGLPIEQEDVEVFALDMTVAQIDGTEIVFLVRGATKLQLQSRKSTDDDSSASDAEASGSPKKDSDLSSFQCDDNSSRGEADLESQSDSEQSAAASDEPAPKEDLHEIPRAAPGTFVVWNNPYFTISNYSDSKAAHAAASMRARLSDRWAAEDLLGTKNKSKTISIRDFDVDYQDPQNSRLVLKAWMLQRVQENDFIQKTKRRKDWFTEEFSVLKRAVGSGTSSARANALIREWLPDIFV